MTRQVNTVAKKTRDENPHELFRTLPDAYDVFLEQATFLRGQRMLEPGAGDGRIARHCLEQGYAIQATLVDIRKEERRKWLKQPTLTNQGNRHLHVADYLQWQAHYEYDFVLCNPPFTKATDFVWHGLHQVRDGGWVCTLQRLNWLGTQERGRWFVQYPRLRYVYLPTWRLTFELPNGDLWKLEQEMAWFCFQLGYQGDPTIRFLFKEGA